MRSGLIAAIKVHARLDAMWLARRLVKEELWRQGIKPSSVHPDDISKAAKAMLKEQPGILAEVEQSITERLMRYLHEVV